MGIDVVENRIEISIGSGPAAQYAAAGIWARATARRDNLPEAMPVSEKLGGIQKAASIDGAELLLAQIDSVPVGFALLVPRPRCVELLYLAADPISWGQGVGSALLARIHQDALCNGTTMELWVIEDNARARDTYERAGWVATDETQIRNAAGRPERRYLMVAS